MADLREEIPQRAFINAEITQMALGTPTFAECINAIRNKYNLREYEFMNQAYVISLLYCLLVVPREMWLKNQPDPSIYEEIEKCTSLKHFTIEIPTDHNNQFFRNRTQSLLRSLRNSVSHARFSIDQDMTFTFWDQRRDGVPQHFRVSISAIGLMEFLSEVGAMLANIRSFKSSNSSPDG